MPYRRRRFASRRRKRSRFGKKRSFSRRVRRVVRAYAEKKRINYSLANNEFDWDGLRVILDRIPQGPGEGERIGRIVQPYAVTARLEILSSREEPSQRTSWTIFLVQDLQQVGDAHAAVSEIISDIGTATAPMGLINVNNKGRFKILRRWQGTLVQETEVGSIKYLHFYQKLRNAKNVRYNGTLNTDIEANGLMLVFVSSGNPTNNVTYVSGNVRFWYTDV